MNRTSFRKLVVPVKSDKDLVRLADEYQMIGYQVYMRPRLLVVMPYKNKHELERR